MNMHSTVHNQTQTFILNAINRDLSFDSPN